MIDYKVGNIIDNEAEALVNSVNCVGVMGRGIALQFKKAFPDNFKAYADACKRGEVQPGKMFVFETGQMTGPRYIINFPTKRHWRGKSRMEDIESGLQALVGVIKRKRIQSIAVPPLGTGLGGLEWSEVQERIEEAIGSLADAKVTVYEPSGAPDVKTMQKSRQVPTMTPGRAALVGLVNRYLVGLGDPFITLLEIHKLMYFMQAAGEPLKLTYSKGTYGPYAENMRHVLNPIEGHLLSGYADGGDEPFKQLQLVPGAVNDAFAYLEQKPDTRSRFDRVSELVAGFESPWGLELLSTVHWIASPDQPETIGDVIALTYAWGERKLQFSERQISLTYSHLVNEGWLTQIPHLDKRKTSLEPDAMRGKMFCCTDKPSPTRCTHYEARLTGVPVRRGEEYDGYDSIVGADDVRGVDARSGFEVVGGAPRGSAGRWSGLDGQPDNHVADTAEPGRR